MADAGKVVTQHDDANRAIGALRDVATVLKHVGDDNVELEQQIADLKAGMELAAHELAADELRRERIAALEGAVADFDRGIIDRHELIALARETSV